MNDIEQLENEKEQSEKEKEDMEKVCNEQKEQVLRLKDIIYEIEKHL